MWRCGHRDVTWSRMLYGFVNLAQTMRCSYWCIGLSAAIGIQNIGNHRHLVHGRSCWAHLRRSAHRGRTHIVYYSSVDLAVELLHNLFPQLCNSLHSASRGPSAAAELLVTRATSYLRAVGPLPRQCCTLSAVNPFLNSSVCQSVRQSKLVYNRLIFVDVY